MRVADHIEVWRTERVGSAEGTSVGAAVWKEVWGRAMPKRAVGSSWLERAVARLVFGVAAEARSERLSGESARARATVFDLQRVTLPNQRLEPTRLAGAVFRGGLLRSTSTYGSKSRDCARQRAAHH